MLFQNLVAIVGFLLLVAPGAFFEILRERRRPSLEGSAFRETSRVALASFAFSLSAILILSYIRMEFPDTMPDLGAWLREGTKYFQRNYRLVLRAVVLEALIALALAYFTNLVFFAAQWGPRPVRNFWRKARVLLGPIEHQSAWYKTFRANLLDQAPLKGTKPVARVKLKDGTLYQGAVDGYSPEMPLENRELELGPPLFIGSVSSAGTPEVARLTPVPVWQRLLVPHTEVEAVWVTYVDQQLITDARKAPVPSPEAPNSASPDTRLPDTEPPRQAAVTQACERKPQGFEPCHGVRWMECCCRDETEFL